MNHIINFVLKNKFAVWLMTIVITVAGITAGLQMKLETIPDITVPVVTATTIYPGATPDQVVSELSEPYEKAVQNLEGVKMVMSSSYQNASSLQIEFEFGTDMKEAEAEVAAALKNIPLPTGAQEPKVARISINAFPVAAISVSSEKDSLAELTENIETNLVPTLEGIEGVSSVAVTGQQLNEISFKFNQDKLAEYGLNEETVKGMVKGSDVTFPLGLFPFEGTEKSVVVDGDITSIEDLNAIQIPVVPSNPGAAPAQPSMVELGEVADIEFVGKAESISRTNGKESIAVQVVKSQGANTVDVVNLMKEEVKAFEKDNADFEIVLTFDQGEPIEKSVETMLSKALFGAGFAVLIILLFLRNIRSTMIAIISIPLSLLIAVLLIKQMDITLNMMTLGAMTVAIGRVIDDSIVVVENIYRRMASPTEQLRGKALIREATKEMFVPILSSTLVTIAVFLPIGLVGGMVGELFLPFALTIVFALLASLLVAITLVPMLSHSLFKKGLGDKHTHDPEKPGKIAGVYRSILKWTLNHKLITTLLAIALFAGSLALVPFVGTSFLPEEDEKMMYVTYTPKPGETKEDVEEAVSDVEAFFIDRKNVESVQVSIGGENPMMPGQNNGALMYVIYEDETPEFTLEKEQAMKEVQKFKTAGEWKSQDFATSGGSNEISYYVYGKDLETIEPVIRDIEEILNEGKNIANIGSTIADSYEEHTLVADQTKLAQYGLTAAQVGMALNPNVQREMLTTIEQDGETFEVYIDTVKQKPDSLEELLNKTIPSPLGMEVAVKDVVTVTDGKTSDTVTRRDGQIYASVKGKITTDDISAESKVVQEKVDKLYIPANVSIETAGVTADMQESFTQLGLAMLAAIAIVYLILVVTFGGAIAPFAILFSLPFTISGALVALLIAGETISISTMIGALMLIGIVVTNAIVLVDRVIHKEKEGLSTRDAILEAGVTRLRPILMTAIATIGALIPLAIGAEGSGLISKGLGVTVIGGLTSSTLLTLIVVPVVYEFLGKFRKRKLSEEEE
ncbi:efflux RND transporter permease subunit [Paenisporosarcina quisquiliarum]|uniref:Efflux RND transporter permease subunit n=1 Tax=Paenisporosarcina quisquiliarum TaxID=365346 RepID=A0A9X3LIT9_9BACL|nr:efflux RND transporter permease subunit [Paenisporosarcina quisquiliarum]MCZ8537786.1 efflux RND transporter permease subunit [Paenisporosarcina quisquiliarum]